MIFDSHAHYDDKQFEEDRSGLLSSLGEHNIGNVVNVGASIETSKHSLELARQYEQVYAAIGVHPSDISCLNPEAMEWLRENTTQKKVVAIGEIGLDYYWEKDEAVRQQQKQWFIAQLQLARELELPVIIHSREAAADTMEIMKEHGQGLQGVIHCYSYAPEMAQEYVKMGYYIGVGGVVTFKNAKKLKETVEAVSMEHLVVETDCPYLAPEPNRGKRNDSTNLVYVIEEIARIKGITPKEVEEITCHNAKVLYGIME